MVFKGRKGITTFQGKQGLRLTITGTEPSKDNCIAVTGQMVLLK